MNELLPIGTKLIATKDFKNIKKGDIGEISKYITETIYRVEFLNDYWSITNLLTFSGVDEELYGICMQVVQENPSMELTIQPPEGCVVDEENSTFQKIKFKKMEAKEVKRWENLGNFNGYFVSRFSEVFEIKNGDSGCVEDRNLFATKEQAEASIALAMLSQLMKEVNGDWKPDWTSSDTKYVINVFEGSVTTDYWMYMQHFLTFQTAEIRDKFLENHIELIEQAKPLL